MDKLQAMRTFVRVVEAGSFSAVAHEADVTQGAISKQVAALETELGARLLTRTTRGDRKSNRMSTSIAHVWGVSGMHTGDCWVDFSKPVARDFSV